MTVHLEVRNESPWRTPCRRDVLARLAQQICEGEGMTVPCEVSLLYCSDPFIRELNRDYRKQDRPTDVLSFAQASGAVAQPRVLGDIVISLDTVARDAREDAQAMRDEVRLLFCHGMLHLLGYTHKTERACKQMAEKQAQYLGISIEEAWPKLSRPAAKRR